MKNEAEGKMRYTQGKIGRIFVIRLEDDDKLPDAVDNFARKENLLRGICIFVGGIKDGKIVVGPEDSKASPVVPLIHVLKNVHETAGVGTIFPDEEGNPKLHMHAAFGREGKTRAGCIRPGIEVADLGEVVVFEIVESPARRKMDKKRGFMVLEP